MQYNLENGIVLYYDDPTHTYKVGGKKVPSVTGITSKGLIKDGLTNWKVTFPLGYAEREINTMLDNNVALDRMSLRKIFGDAQDSTDKIMKEAGKVGSVVHGLVEDYLKNKEMFNDVHSLYKFEQGYFHFGKLYALTKYYAVDVNDLFKLTER